MNQLGELYFLRISPYSQTKPEILASFSCCRDVVYLLSVPGEGGGP